MKNALLVSTVVAALVGACQSPDKPAATAGVNRPVPAATTTRQPVPAADSAQLLKSSVPVGYRVQYTVAGDLNRDA